METERIQVAVRVRPISASEKALDSRLIVSTDTPSGEVTLLNPVFYEFKNQTEQLKKSEERKFYFDYSFSSLLDDNNRHYSNQQDIFEAIGKPMIKNCITGFNCSLFAYGVYTLLLITLVAVIMFVVLESLLYL